MFLVRALGRHIEAGRLEELTLTTNGSQLARYADELYDAGVRRINVSVDTLNPEKFHQITRWGDLSKVMEGIDAAQRAGPQDQAECGGAEGLQRPGDARDAAFRPWPRHGSDRHRNHADGEIDEDRTDQYLPLSELRAQLEEQFTLVDNSYQTGGPARYVTVKETGGRLGFITPMTHNFCESCNRVRLTCTGTLYMCLGQNDAADLRTALRASDDDAYLSAAIDEAITRKPKGHDFIIDRNNRPAVARHMSVTGGDPNINGIDVILGLAPRITHARPDIPPGLDLKLVAEGIVDVEGMAHAPGAAMHGLAHNLHAM